MPAFPLVVVVLMLVGFAVVSPFGGRAVVGLGWSPPLVLAAWAAGGACSAVRDLVRAAHPGFAIWVLALGVVVAGLAGGFLGDAVATPGPRRRRRSAGSLLIAVLATVLANVLTNLSATLLLVPLVAPLGTTAVLAALLGLNIGSGLTWTGSLANLLWRRTLTGDDAHPAAGVPPGLADPDAARAARGGRRAVADQLNGTSARKE